MDASCEFLISHIRRPWETHRGNYPKSYEKLKNKTDNSPSMEEEAIEFPAPRGNFVVLSGQKNCDFESAAS